VSLDGACPLAPTFDTCGWFARDPELLERVGRVLLGDTSRDRPGKLLIADDAFKIAGDVVTGALGSALERVSSLIGKPAGVTVAGEGLSQWFRVFRVLQGAEIWAGHGDWVTRVKPKLGPGVKERIEWTSTIRPAEVDAAREERETIARRMNALLAGNAILVLPTVPGIAPLRNRSQEELNEFRNRAISLLCVAGLARLPQVSLPLADLDGCPLGLSLVAARGKDTMLLSLARELVL
jgi:amidase